MIIAGTGHRPNKLGGYTEEVFQKLVLLAMTYLKLLKATKVISGMALGWDMALAQAAINLGIPFIAAIPFKGQESVWPPETKQRYYRLLGQAEGIRYCSSPGFTSAKMQKRNEWMVDRLDPRIDKILTIWDGTPGGTANCINYALSKGFSFDKNIINLWDEFEKIK